uniref:Chemokine interleukin-8-like domain-containing protein n=1 Tax=Chelydra serpentina TaxID=8475 RepID=A0A8C3S2U2_CHESE
MVSKERGSELIFPFDESLSASSLSLLGGELRCRCLQTASGLMSPKHLVHVEIIPKGPQCGTVEVMAGSGDGLLLCLSSTLYQL